MRDDEPVTAYDEDESVPERWPIEPKMKTEALHAYLNGSGPTVPGSACRWARDRKQTLAEEGESATYRIEWRRVGRQYYYGVMIRRENGVFERYPGGVLLGGDLGDNAGGETVDGERPPW